MHNASCIKKCFQTPSPTFKKNNANKLSTKKTTCSCRSCILRLHYPALRHFSIIIHFFTTNILAYHCFCIIKYELCSEAKNQKSLNLIIFHPYDAMLGKYLYIYSESVSESVSLSRFVCPHTQVGGDKHFRAGVGALHQEPWLLLSHLYDPSSHLFGLRSECVPLWLTAP